jgi:signal peptidase
VLRTVILTTLFALVIGLVLALIVVPRVAGAVPLNVLSGSMNPTIRTGSVVVVRPVDVESLRIGDVITYQVRSGDPTLVTHRIVGISAGSGEPTFRTKGDANDTIDRGVVRSVQIRGKVWYAVPVVGYVTNALETDQRGWGARVLAGGLIVWALWLVGGALRDAIRGKQQPA